MLTAIFLYPGISALIILAIGRLRGNIGSSIYAIINRSILTLGTCRITRDFISNNLEVVITLGDWITVNRFKVKWVFVFDNLTLIRSSTVCVVSLRVHIYSLNYRRNDPHLGRFMAFLSRFTFFRLLLVTAGNLVIFYAGWEGIGLCSFLLIGFWYDRPQAVKASLKAIFYNRIGDIAFLLARGLLYKVTVSLNFSTVERIYPVLFSRKKSNLAFSIIGRLFLISVIAKSSQLRLHLWLPDAMEGPTPVSALIHAATRVTAGLYLRLRRNCIFASSQELLTLIRTVGAVTALFGSLTALFQYDIKRIIAFSTCSQLGYMRAAFGRGSFEATFSHLTRHAYFKALLFLLAGIIIHKLNNEQDIQKRGGLYKLYPFVYTAFLIANRALCAVFGTAGYYSKDLILEVAYAKSVINRAGIYFRLSFSAIITRLYTLRRLYLVFYRKTNVTKANLLNKNKHPLSRNLILVISILSIASLVSGYLMSELRNPINLKFANIKLFFVNSHNDLRVDQKLQDLEFRSSHIKKAVWKQYRLVASLVSLVSYFKREVYRLYFTRLGATIRLFFSEKRRIDSLRNNFSLFRLKEAFNSYFIVRDKVLIESIGARGLDRLTKQTFSFYSLNQKQPFIIIRFSFIVPLIASQLI